MKSKKRECRLIALCSVLALCSAGGETASWTNNSPSATTALWTVPANWTNESGEVLTEMPTNGQDIVFNAMLDIPAADASGEGKDSARLYEQTIGTGESVFNPKLARISGQEGYTLRFHDRVEQTQFVNGSGFHKISIDAPNDFLGFWLSGGARTTFLLNPTASFTPVMHNFSSKHRPVVDVPSAGTQAKIEWLYDAGAVEKTGSGDLEIGTTTGDRAAVYLKGGTLTLRGTEDGALETILAKAALHLDASVKETLSTGPSNGYESVFCWYDVRGAAYGYATNSAYSTTSATYIPFANPPFLSDSAVSPTGRRLVDFGSRSNPDRVKTDYPSRGPTNCVLMLDKRLTDVRAVFYACSHPNGSGNSMTLGDGSTVCFVSGSNSELFDLVYSDPAVRHGDLLVNLQKRLNKGIGDDGTLTNLYTFAGGFVRGAPVSMLGSRQHYVSTTGGTRMGELILFTNELTRAERTLVARYIDAKWRTGDVDCDLGALMATNVVATVTVPEGKTATIRTVDAPGGFVKKGGGVLEIGSIQNAGIEVAVSGGSVAFAKNEVTTSAPADNPYVWLDATDGDSLTDASVEGNPTNYISAWKDTRSGVSSAATSNFSEPPQMPFVVRSDIVNRNVVDFGTFRGWDFSWMKLPNWGTGTHSSYSAFIVFRNKGNSNNSSIAIFGSSKFVSYRDTFACLVSPYYMNPIVSAATWAINGHVVDPVYTCNFGKSYDEFQVISVRSRTPLAFDALAKDRSGSSEKTYAGGVQIGEYIIYDHPLTYDEHRNTEAYLMKKWLGKDHPDVAHSIAGMKFADGAPVDLAFAADTALDYVSGGTGEFSKSGDGALVVTHVQPSSIATSISVKDGSLTLITTNGPLNELLSEAAYRFDASAAYTLASYEVIDGVTNVLSWKSLVGGITADAIISDVAKMNPVLKYVETRPGVVRPVMDFGEYCSSTNDVITDGIGASMRFSARQTGLKEIHQIFADANGSTKQWVVGDVAVSDVNAGHDFGRGPGGQLYTSASPYGASSIVRNSKTRLDGTEVAVGQVIGSGFHNFNFRCYNSRPDSGYSSWTVAAGAFAGGRDVMAGGQQIAESLGFKRLLTDDERAHLNAFLNWKWLGGTSPALEVTNSIGSVSLENGAILRLTSLDGLTVFNVASLSGDGTLVADNVTGVSSLSFNVAADGTADSIAVDGSVTFAPPVSVTVSFEEGFTPVYGEQTLFTATSAANLSAENVSVDCPKLHKCVAKVIVADNSIRMCFAPKGTIFSFR